MKQEINLIISIDYEIFGDGSGDIKKDLIQPTNKILSICDKYDIKLTIFFEAAEYWAFKEAEKKKLLKLNYSPSKLMEEQIKKATKKGHNVQLHLHPQWLKWGYNKGIWNLNYNWWRISKLPYGNKKNKKSILGAIYQGKQTLEKILKPINRNYKCMAFRAGAWCIQPSEKVLKGLKSAGLKVDSTIFKGGYLNNNLSFYDFRNAKYKSSPWWTNKKDINKETNNKNSILEVPISSFSYRGIKKLNANKVINYMFKTKNKEKSSKFTNQKINVIKQRNIRRILDRLFKKSARYLDINLEFKNMMCFLNSVEKERDSKIKSLVMIGHPKIFNDLKDFEKFLIRIKEKENIRFSTYQEVYNKMRKK